MNRGILGFPGGGTQGALPISAGGTGATDAAGARSALGLGGLATKNQADIADIAATGTPGSSNYLRGDGTWATVSGAPDFLLTNAGVI